MNIWIKAKLLSWEAMNSSWTLISLGSMCSPRWSFQRTRRSTSLGPIFQPFISRFKRPMIFWKGRKTLNCWGKHSIVSFLTTKAPKESSRCFLKSSHSPWIKFTRTFWRSIWCSRPPSSKVILNLVSKTWEKESRITTYNLRRMKKPNKGTWETIKFVTSIQPKKTLIQPVGPIPTSLVSNRSRPHKDRFTLWTTPKLECLTLLTKSLILINNKGTIFAKWSRLCLSSRGGLGYSSLSLCRSPTLWTNSTRLKWIE